MIRLIAVAFALTLATSVQAMSPVPLHQSDSMITQIRQACGAGMYELMVVCVTTAVRREVRRCAGWSGGRLRSVVLKRQQTKSGGVGFGRRPFLFMKANS